MLLILLVGLVITVTIAGVTYGFTSFKYLQSGDVTSSITVGGITFSYDETTKKGHGISITDSFPVDSNATAKTSSNYFEFKITSSKNNSNIEIPYVVTARLDQTSDSILGNIVDMYLTEVNNSTETPTMLFSSNLVKYNDLQQYLKISDYTEKVIYQDTVSTTTYQKTFRLRMWVDENTTLDVGSGSNNYNNTQFKVTVNVYSDGDPTGATVVAPASQVGTQEGISLQQKIDILNDLID